MIALLVSLLAGVLMDASGAVIPGATISISGANVRRAVETAGDGSYSFAELAPGDYRLNVDYPGFDAFEARVTVEPGKMLQVPIRLRPRAPTQSITVTEDREVAEPAGVTIKDSALDALPDNPDDLLDMLRALAGPAGGGGGAEMLIDGFNGGQLPSKNSIKEIRINQDPFSTRAIRTRRIRRTT